MDNKRFYYQLNHKSPYYFFERMVICHIKHPLFHSVFFFTNCKRTNVDGFYLIHLTLFFMLSSNAKIGKLPMFSTLGFVKPIFSFSGFSIIVPSLFLLPILLIKPYCVPITYKRFNRISRRVS